MTYKGYSIAGFMLISISTQVFSQGEIFSVNPPSAFKGETIHLIIQGSGTEFAQENLEVNFPDFIKVESILVNSPDLATIKIFITKSAPEGLIQFDVISKNHVYNLEFEVVILSTQVEAMINVYPIQSLSIADYDFSNPQYLPILFTISVYPAGIEYCSVVVKLHHENYGLIASAEKELTVFGQDMITFNNTEFDSYDIDKASDEISEATSGGGNLPSGIYRYTVILYNQNNVQIADPIEAEFYIPESVSGIDAIAPGTPLEEDPDIVSTNTPYFQWFGGLSEYRFTLYEVMDDQNSADDITTNLPVFEMDGITSSSFIYPAYAEMLEKGKMYAWQITSSIMSGSGSQVIYSDVYWFVYRDNNKRHDVLNKIEVSSDDVDLYPGDSVKVGITGFNIDGEIIQTDCQFRIVPTEGGRINREGLLVAGDKPGTYAVIVTCGKLEDYITVNILSRKK